jgi:hypothetical protein
MVCVLVKKVSSGACWADDFDRDAAAMSLRRAPQQSAQGKPELPSAV